MIFIVVIDIFSSLQAALDFTTKLLNMMYYFVFLVAGTVLVQSNVRWCKQRLCLNFLAVFDRVDLNLGGATSWD
jgi:hypothetical protein